MITLTDLEGALCAAPGVDPLLFDPDSHQHLRLGRGNACWLCEDAFDICEQCPVRQACFRRAKETRESFMIYAGFLWSAGRPREIHKRRR